jgi:hypothetical protein
MTPVLIDNAGDNLHSAIVTSNWMERWNRWKQTLQHFTMMKIKKKNKVSFLLMTIHLQLHML